MVFLNLQSGLTVSLLKPDPPDAFCFSQAGFSTECGPTRRRQQKMFGRAN